MRTSLRCLFGIVVLAAGVHPQCPVVSDINRQRTPFDSDPVTGRIGEGGTVADGMLRCGNHWYFVATAPGVGEELWKTDGTTAGTVLVRDIYAGVADSEPFYLTCCNGRVFFRARTGSSGAELWMTDGTAAGTVMIKDIRPGSESSNPSNLCCLGNKVLFTATDGATGFELWVTDGTAAGTRLLKDIWPGARSGAPVYLKRSLLGRVYFQADDGTSGAELWVTDGTAAGTRLLKDIRPGAGGSLPAGFVDNPANPLETLFRAIDGVTGAELWKTDGTPQGTVLVKDIRPGPVGSGPYLYHAPHAVLGGAVYFGADDGTHGNELWKTDGTAAGTVLVQDIDTGIGHSDPDMFRVSGNTLYMQATTAAAGTELFALVAGSVGLVQDIQRGAASSSPSHLARLANGRVVFEADTGVSGSGREPWITDGTGKGTGLLRDIYAGAADSRPVGFTPILAGGRLLFFAADGSTTGSGRELYETDGTAAGTRLLKDVYPGSRSNSSSPAYLTSVAGSVLYFAADDGLTGRELWKTDATGTTLLKDIQPGAGGSDPSGFIELWTGSRHVTLFRADDGKNGAELWVTDGTPAGTTMLKDIARGSDSSKPNNFGRFGGRVFFSARTAATGYELWATDGTAAGTVLVKDIDAGTGSSLPYDFTVFRGALYFVAFVRGGTGRELWRTDGSAAGTVLVKDIRPGSSDGTPRYLTPFGDVMLFQANDGGNGAELWRTDGTTAGTVLVRNIAQGSIGGHPASLTRFGNAVYFAASDSISGTELWKTDGTTAGTVLVKDLRPGADTSLPSGFTVSRGRLFFRADDGTNGMELWISDGTAAGTTLVKDIHSGGRGSSPSQLRPAGAGVYFSADDGQGGAEVFFSDGTAAGTVRVCDLNPGPAPSYPSAVTVSDGILYFLADDGTHGFELFRIANRSATVERLGDGCGPGMPSLDATQPVVGRPCTVAGTGPRSGGRLLVVGLPHAPFHVAGLAAPGCAIWVDLTAPILLPLPTGARWSLPVAVPNQSAAVGVQVSLQAAQDPQPLALSNGVQLTIGT